MNFFKKYWIIILIILVFIVGIVLFRYFYFPISNLNKKTQNKDSEDEILNNLDFLYPQDKIKIKQKRKEIKELKKEFDDLIEQCKITKNFDPSKPVKDGDRLGTDLFWTQEDLNQLINDFEIPRIFGGVDITELHLKRIITTANFRTQEINDLRKKIHNLKKETAPPKSKIKITKEKFDIIKNYILSENENEILTLNDLSQEEKNEIEKVRNSQKQTLEFRKKVQQNIDEKEQECNGYTSQINEIINQIQQLQKQLQPKEEALANKEKDINKLQLQRQTKTTELQTQGKPIYKNNELNKIKEEISKLQDERLALVKQISAVKVQIGHLKSDQTMYENMLTRAQNYKKDLEKDYNNLTQDEQSTLSSLNSFYEITSNEG